MVNILVVEDNEITRKSIVKTIQKTLVNCMIFEAGSGKQAILLLENHQIDFFFLDVELPDFNGMEVAKKIRAIERYEFIHIVFITTHITLLPKALQEYHCYDFIEKPFKMEKIVDTINQLVKGINKVDQQDKNKYIVVTQGIVSNKLLVKDIYFVESEGRHVTFHTKNGSFKEGSSSLKKVMLRIENLGTTKFVRSHKAFIVNSEYIVKIEQTTRSSGTIYFENYQGVALLGETFKDEVKTRFEGSE